MQERWLHAIRRPELKKILPVDQPFHMFICLDHFKKSDIVSLGGRTCLKAGVIPSVFKWMEHEKKMELPAAATGTLKSKLVKRLDKEVITVTCGTLEAELHKEKFYCPGIHRECIKYNNQFITPKMFMIMGDKERLKDWKNAVRIHGVKIRKFIENKQLDFYRHKEFCTGRCVARLPVNLFRTKAQPPEHFINTSGDISNVRFLETDRRPDYNKPDSTPYIENEIEDEIENENESDESIDEKPDIDVLNELLKRPIPTTITQESNSSFGITDNQVFWRGVVKLGLIAKCFDVIKDHINTLQTDFVLHNVRQEDAHELSCIVREMGLSNNLQHMLASCKQDMDNHYEKLDQEMEELKQKVSQYENRKRMLKLKSDEFKAILNLNTPKAATQTKMESDESDEEVSVHFASSSPQQNSNLTSNKRLTVHSPSEVAGPSTKRLKFSTNNGSEEVLDVLVTSPANVPTIKLEKVSDTAASAEEVKSKVEDDTSTLPKIVSVTSMQHEDAKSPNVINSNSDVTALEDIQNVVANGQQMAEQILQSAGDDERGDHSDDDMQAIDTNNMSIINESSVSSTGPIVKKDQSQPNPNVRTVLWVKSNGTSEYITFSNNSETNSSAEAVTVCDQSEDSTTSSVTNQTASIPVPPAQSKDEEISAINNQSSDIADKANQSEITTENVIKADVNKDSNITEEKADKKQSQDQSNDNIVDELEKEKDKTLQNSLPSEPVSETGSMIKVRKLSEKSLGESEEGDSKRSVSPLFGDDLFTDIVGSRRSTRKRVAKVKDDL
ncbi:hypothetical protein SNE40_021589 [Patella caerulea]